MNNTATLPVPRLVREPDGREFALGERLTTIGASSKCRIVITGEGIPAHLAHIVFSGGVWSIAAVSRTPPVSLNGVTVVQPAPLANGDRIAFGKDVWVFRSVFSAAAQTHGGGQTPLHRFIGALSRFSRTGDSDARFELLAGIAQLLAADGARLVAETAPGSFSTIARYPQSSGLDRFSERAIVWAKEKAATVLMHDTDWASARDSQGSLELNRIGSVVCRPIYEGDAVRGFLYVDRHRDKPAFADGDRDLLDDVGPVFGDLLALYERSNRQRETIAALQRTITVHDTPLIFECEAMAAAIDRAAKFAATDSTVLVTGETGTGKELFARFIHRHSNRAGREFCAVNCGALPENLIESELFGHEKGAFTGAYQKKKGLFERAQGGTVFLDEIGDMPLNLQVKLLRVLQESEMLPLGATATVKVDVRIIAATNRELAREVRGGAFREDLFYRLNVLEIAVPPLRHRHRDVLLLADFFIIKYSGRFGIAEKGVSLPAQAKLLGNAWPGNIRQLENAVQKALLISKGGLLLDTDFDLPAQNGNVADEPQTSNGDVSVPTLKDARIAAERTCIRQALARANGNISVAARLLDTDRKWLTRLMKLHGITGEG